MTDDSKATPRPWKVVEEAALDYRPDIITTADGNSRIAVMYGGGPVRAIDKAEERANAALIVTAVNAHDALVAERDRLRQALEEAEEVFRPIIGYISEYIPMHDYERAKHAVARIREALGDG